MPFELREVTEADFPEVVRGMWYTYENPVQDLFRVFCPLNSTGKVDREAAVKESIDRFWEWHHTDPTSYWHKVVDTDNKETLVGAALWKIYPENPYEKPHEHFDAYWHPEGGQREFATQAFWQHEATKEELARRPHLYLNIIFTLPEYQKKGIANIILEWGINKAKEIGVEMWLDAWQYGRPVYEKKGFTVVKQVRIKPTTDNPDEAWKACEKEWADMDEWAMWRPKDGPYVEGKSIKPWEQ